MVKSPTVSLTVIPVAPPVGKVKTAEVVIGLIRFPFVSDKAIVNGLFPRAQEELAKYDAELVNPRFRKATIISEELVFDVYEPPPTSPSPVPWVLIIYTLLAIATGALIVLCIVLYLRVISLEKTLADVGKTIMETMAEKEDALAAGKISEEYAKTLNEQLMKAYTKAEEAGVGDWWNMLEKIIGYLPIIIGAVILITVVGMMPRPRREE